MNNFGPPFKPYKRPPAAPTWEERAIHAEKCVKSWKANTK